MSDFSLNQIQNQKSFGKWLTKCAKFNRNFFLNNIKLKMIQKESGTTHFAKFDSNSMERFLIQKVEEILSHYAIIGSCDLTWMRTMRIV